jgi:hypothetical protein
MKKTKNWNFSLFKRTRTGNRFTDYLESFDTFARYWAREKISQSLNIPFGSFYGVKLKTLTVLT